MEAWGSRYSFGGLGGGFRPGQRKGEGSLSPTHPGEHGYTAQSWDHCPPPMLLSIPPSPLGPSTLTSLRCQLFTPATPPCHPQSGPGRISAASGPSQTPQGLSPLRTSCSPPCTASLQPLPPGPICATPLSLGLTFFSPPPLALPLPRTGSSPPGLCPSNLEPQVGNGQAGKGDR